MDVLYNPIAYPLYLRAPGIYISLEDVPSNEPCWVELYDEHDLRNHQNFVGDNVRVHESEAPLSFHAEDGFYTAGPKEALCAGMVYGCYAEDGFYIAGPKESLCVVCKRTLMLHDKYKYQKFGVLCVKCCEEKCSSKLVCAQSGESIQKFRPGVEPFITVNSDYQKYVHLAYEHENIKG